MVIKKITYTKKRIGWWYLLTIGIIILDLVSKILLDGKNFEVISGFVSFISVHNEGASFGILNGAQVFFIIIAVLFGIGMVLFDILYNKNFGSNGWYKVGFTLILGGLVGNLIDRIAFGYVRDFIHLDFMNFPVFNVADISLTVGCICLAVFLLFFCRFEKTENINSKSQTTDLNSTQKTKTAKNTTESDENKTLNDKK